MEKNAALDSFKVFGSMASTWGKPYSRDGYKERYPTIKIRQDIVLSILKKIRPKKILDIGCGSAEPLIEMLNLGFAAEGFDYSQEMLEKARENLKKAGYPEDLVYKNNMEKPKGIDRGEFDCLVANGAVFYARDFDKTMKNLTALLPKGGHFIFSLQNELFSLFSMNKYSVELFLDKLMPTEAFSEETRQKVSDFIQGRFREESVERKFKTIRDFNIHNLRHNPLRVDQEILAPNNLTLEGMYFFHYHSMPPIFEHTIPEEFRKTSATIENPTDWRGLFMASCFNVHARKSGEGKQVRR